eukprot:SAG11_NODE_36533_length_261_cov_0.629630_1_plen_51_part_10
MFVVIVGACISTIYSSGHGTKIRYISVVDVHSLYSMLPEPKLLGHGTKTRY